METAEHLQMKYLILAAAVLSTACTTPVRMDYNGLNTFKINCDKKEEQMAFLQSQLPTEREAITNYFIISNWSGFFASNADGTYNDRQKLFNNYHTAVIKANINQLRQQCLGR